MTNSYQLLVLDIDGTLVNESKEITPKTREAILSVQKQGVRIALATGRTPFGILRYANALRLKEYDGYVLAYNGGRIVRWQTGEVIFEQTLPDRLDEICALARKYHVAILTYYNDRIVTEQPEDPFVQYESRVIGMPLMPVVDLARYVQSPVVKCVMLAEGPYLAQVEPRVRDALGEDFSVYRSEPYFLEIMPRGIDKAASLQRLLEYLSLPREAVVCCGDALNDRTMIRYAGLGVAMGNAVPEVKAEADFVTRSNEEDGVAYVIERFFPNSVDRSA